MDDFGAPGLPWREERFNEPEPLRSLPQSDAEDDDGGVPDISPHMRDEKEFEIEPK